MKDDARQKVLDEFESNEFRILIAVDALNAGLNVPDVDSAICVAGVSTELTMVQQLGRTSRKTTDSKKAIFINLFCKNTVEETWIKKKTNTLKDVK